MSSEIIKKTNQVLSKIPETLNKSDIQRLNRMIADIEDGRDDPKKNNEILKIMKMKMASSKKTIDGVKAIAVLEKQELPYQKAQIQDGILSVIIEKSSYPLFQIGEAYRRLKSFDKLLEAISQAKEKGWALSRAVDVMELEEV